MHFLLELVQKYCYIQCKMNDRFELNHRMVRAYLEEGDRKHSHLVKELGVSDSLVAQMLRGYVPREETVRRLAMLMGCKVEDLLIPKTTAKETA